MNGELPLLQNGDIGKGAADIYSHYGTGHRKHVLPGQIGPREVKSCKSESRKFESRYSGTPKRPWLPVRDDRDALGPSVL